MFLSYKGIYGLILPGMMLVSSCAVNESNREKENETTAEESIVKIEALPDTTYESINLINSTTIIKDSLTEGKLNSLEDMYAGTPGVFAFRANSHRDADMYGKVKGIPSEIVTDWVFSTDTDNRTAGTGRSWGGGSGWTGQPVYVEWPDSLIKKYQNAGSLSKDFSGKEIIVGSLASNLYFIDFATGKASREPIFVGNPIKGSISLDPTLNGNIYVGHGIPNLRPFGAIVVNLDTHDVSDTFGEDSSAPRHWGAYDSNAIRAAQYLFRPGENGVIYKFMVEPGNLRLHSSMSYTLPKGGAPGIESSMSIYKNYGYTADNHGYIVCTNLDTMKPVWVYSLEDDTDSTPVILEEDDIPYLYVGCEIDRTAVGKSRFVKLNALDGKEVWKTEIEGKRYERAPSQHFDGGYYATALPGKGNCKDLLFNNVVINENGQNGKFIALNRKTGDIIYEIPTRSYAWSSPVGFLNESGEMFVLTGDCSGNMYIIDGKKGKILNTTHIGNNFESSPVVSGNSAVVGSRGNSIYKVSLQ